MAKSMTVGKRENEKKRLAKRAEKQKKKFAGCEISGNPDNAKHAILEEVKKELDRADAEKAQ